MTSESKATRPELPFIFENTTVNLQNVPTNVKECLTQSYNLYFQVFNTDTLPTFHNVLHELLNHHPKKLIPIQETFSRKVIYQAYILDFNRLRTLKFIIRWWRRDWYGKEDTDPVIYMWKNFVQHIGTFYTCRKHDCSHKQITPGSCPNHSLPLIRKWSDKNEYKTLNGALSNLCDKGVTSYFNLRILDISMKSPIRLFNECFNYEKGWPLIILFVEKGTMIKIEFLKHFKLFGIIPYPSSGQSTIQADELLTRILQGELCQRCFKHKSETSEYSWNDDCWHKFYTKDQSIYLFSITDYDPTGFSISNTIAKHMKNTNSKVKHKRIGLTKEQIESWNLEQNKYHILPERHQKWEHAFIFDDMAHGVEMDQISNWETDYFRFILEFILNEIGIDGWNDYAKQQSEDEWESELEELITEQAEKLTKKHDPLYLLLGETKSNIEEIISYLNTRILKLADKQAELYIPYEEAIKQWLDDTEPWEEDDFDDREEIEEKVIHLMHNKSQSFKNAVEELYDTKSFLHNDSLLEKIKTLLSDYEDEIIDLVKELKEK